MRIFSCQEFTPAQKRILAFAARSCFIFWGVITYTTSLAQNIAAAKNSQVISYLKKNFTSDIQNVIVNRENVIIRGNISGNQSNLYLCELPMFDEITTTPRSFLSVTPIDAGPPNFRIQVKRFIQINDTTYDRIYSRWVITTKTGQDYQLQSYAHYPEDITDAAFQYLPEEKPANKKGLGGFWAVGGVNQDLTDLNIKNVTVNVVVPTLISLTPTIDTFNFSGQTYYFNPTAVRNFDKTFKLCSDHNIFVSVILLIQQSTPDSLKPIFVYRGANKGVQTMANITSLTGLNYYAAVVGFLAKRYTRPDKKFGRINNWIVHNEVDNGDYWTNAGTAQMEYYTELYDRSMRTVYYTVRQYDPAAKVFFSSTHFWASTDKNKVYTFFPPKQMLETFSDLSKKQGDYEWGLAYHPYPQDNFNPRSWNDKNATADINTSKYVTPKNIELIDQWICMRAHLYKGLKVRTLLFSEEGVHSKSYNQDDLLVQAAGLAYMWKRFNRLPTLEAMDYHRQTDNLNERGLKPGLWTVKPGTTVSPDKRKPAWYVYQKAGTPSEDSAFAFALPIIGVTDWSQIFIPLKEEAPPVKVIFDVTNSGAPANDVSVYFNGEMHKTINGKAIFYNVASLSRERNYRLEQNGTVILAKQKVVVTKDETIPVNILK